MGTHTNDGCQVIMKTKHKASVVFEPDVRSYVDDLAKRLDRERSWIINAIVRDYARRVGAGENLELFDPSDKLASTRGS